MSSFGRFGNNQHHAVGEFSICIKPLDGKGHARKRPLTVKSWSTVKDVKDILQSLLHLPAASQRLFFRGGELRNPRTLQDCGIYRDGQTVYLASSPQDEMGKPYSLEPFLGAGGLPRSLARVLGQARRGLDRGFKPELTLEGTGGTYFLQDAARQKVAVFKPQDEEPFAPNNPRDAMQGGLGGAAVSMRPGIDAGESYLREVAAYMLDDRHLHGVPATTLVEAKHPAFCYWDHKERMKLGSFQEFVRHDMVVEDISPSRLSSREVQKIALLDMRILNRDRNSVNILVRSRPRRTSSFSDRARTGSSSCHRRHGSSDSKIGLSMSSTGPQSCAGVPGGSRFSGSGRLSDSGSGFRRSGRLTGGSTTVEYELIPIDHGLSLSDELVIDWCDWCWLDWRQVKEPIEPELLKYIDSFNPEATAKKLGNTLNLQEQCLRNLCIAEIVLKEGAAVGLTLYDIACILRREDFDKISDLETLVARATELARASLDHQNSAAPSKRTVNDITSKSLEARKPDRSRVNHFSHPGSTDWASGEKEGWTLAPAQEETMGVEQTQLPPPLSTHGSSTEASSEDMPALPDLRVSGDSVDSSGGEGSERMLRIWAPGMDSLSRDKSAAGTTAFALSRGNSATEAEFRREGRARLSSPSRSAESDNEPVSPVGFWQEKFETIDARNATRSFSLWGDSGSGEEASPEADNGLIAGDRDHVGPGTAGGRPPRTGGALFRDQSGSKSEIGVGIGRKLFASPDRARRPPAVAAATASLSTNLESMAEGDHELTSPMDPPDESAHPRPFWAARVEPGWDTLGRGGGGEEKGGSGPGWRRGEAGLVVPEPLPSKSRVASIQHVVPKRSIRIGNDSAAEAEAKRPLAAPRPATTSPTLPAAGEHKSSKAPPDLRVLTPGVKIVRSYSYHGLGSMALYDSTKRGTAQYSLRKRPNENSEQFKVCFFRFFRFLVRDFVKRRYRRIVKERGPNPSRSPADEPSSATAAAAAAAATVASTATGRGAGGEYSADDRLKRLPSTASSHASVPATVRG